MTASRTLTPNLFVVGAAKAGTTTMHTWLNSHANVFMSQIKETNYFADVSTDAGMRHLTKQLGAAEYQRQFRGVRDEIWVGESSPAYLYDRESASRIRQASPEAQIIIMLRDPVARAYSHYLMDVREGVQRLSFADALAADQRVEDRTWGGHAHLYVDLGMYTGQVERYVRQFGSDRILVIDTFQLQRPDLLGHRLQSFLGLKEPFPFTRNLAISNPYRRPSSPTASAVLRSPRLRRAAQRFVPGAARRLVRDRILLRATEPPVLDAHLIECLDEVYREDLHALSQLLGVAMPQPELGLRQSAS